MSADKNDTNQPILILVRRGRGGRGYLVSPVDAPTDAAPCSTANEVGDVVLELLDDENQPRVNLDQILAMSSDDYEPVDDEDEEEEEGVNGERRPMEASDDEDEDEDDEEGEVDEGEGSDEDKPWWDVRGAQDPADQLLVNMLGGVLGKAQQASSRKRGRQRRSRPKKRRTK